MKSALVIVLLGLALCTAFSAEPEKIVEIRLAGQPEAALSAYRGKVAECSPKHVSKYHLVPGIADSKLVSLEQVGATGFYLRHQKFVVFLHARPKNENGGYDADASFKLVHEGDNVRFEASNYPGMFITVRDDGIVITARNPDPAKSTFLLKKD